METLEFARGPLFIATVSFMVLGLLRHVILRTWGVIRTLRQTPHKNVPWGKVIRKSAEWVLPVNHMKTAPGMKLASILFHIGLLLVPIFLAEHIFLWARGIGISLPALSSGLADQLTVLTLLTGFFLLSYRIFNRISRELSSRIDYFLPVAVLLPFLSGFLASHPAWSPLPYESMMLVHVLSAELTFILLPTTKLAHAVLFPFDRLSTDIYWRFVPGAGDRVAEVLRGNTEGAEV
jgi:nitrate reductase gamma subunit